LEDRVSLESALAGMERQTEIAAASAKRLLSAVLAARRASVGGDLSAMKKALGDAGDTLRVAQLEFQNALTAWPFDDQQEQELFESGEFTRELIAAAAELGVTISDEDGRLMCYPSIVRVEPAKRLVTIDKKPHRAVRPAVLAAYLRAQQTRTVRFRPAPFLEALYSAWNYARHADPRAKESLRDVPVARIHAVLTVAPGAAKEYSLQEFGRDLLLLERGSERLTKKGAEIHFSRSTGSKGGRGIRVVREDGTPVVYSSIRFTEAGSDGS
jgi:hypothetical protein